MMQTATFAKRRRNAVPERGMYPEALSIGSNVNGRESFKSKITFQFFILTNKETSRTRKF